MYVSYFSVTGKKFKNKKILQNVSHKILFIIRKKQGMEEKEENSSLLPLASECQLELGRSL